MAVGSYVKKGTYENLALAETWNGVVWKIQSSHVPTTSASELWSVSCTRAAECTAVGYKGSLTLAEGWNGNRWYIQSTPSLGKAYTSEFYGVSCVGSGTCVAVATVGTSARGSLAFAEI